ncbi:MAG: FtsQ-type POTRA domain-containing protein [Erysipelotrichaceae bacterium]|nr:FtsQ-type POTRA domain-containing protein [Erysipelotrichaceae bacterium]
MEKGRDDIVYTNQVDRQYMLQKRRKVQLEKRIKTSTWILRLLFIVLSIAYLASEYSRIKVIHIEGNNIVDTEYIKETSGLTLESYYYLFAPSIVEHKLKENPFIRNVEVSRKGDNIVSISVEEIQVVASYTQEGQLYYLISDGSSIALTSESISYMNQVPYLIGLESEEEHIVELRKRLASSLSQVNADVLALMSEIVWFPLSYDETQLKIHMVDHNIVFVPIYYVDNVNDYRKIATSLTSNEVCVFFDSDDLHPYVGDCLDSSEISYPVIEEPLEDEE